MINKYITVCMGIITFLGMVLLPEQCLNAAADGLDMSLKIIIPSLFPFFICSKILIKSGFAKKMGNYLGGIMRPLFNVPGCGSFAFIVGILSGYPVGAKCAVDLYNEKACTKTEAQRLICFCNNSGPLFIIGSVATGMLVCKEAGIYLYLAHILSAFTVGIIFRFYNPKTKSETIINEGKKSSNTTTDIFSVSIFESVELILFVCGFIIFFSVFLKILGSIGIIDIFIYVMKFFNIPADVSTAIFYSIVEMVNGIRKICNLELGTVKLSLISMAIGWGGISVMLQVFGVTSGNDFSKKAFIAAKGIQSILAGIYTTLLLYLPFGEIQTFSHSYTKFTMCDIWTYSLLLLLICVILFSLLSVCALLVKSVNKL